MTNLQEDRLSMFFTLEEYRKKFTALTSPLPKYTENSVIFSDTIPKIQDLAEQQKRNPQGVTVNKNNLKEKVIINSIDYSRKLTAFAQFTGNVILANEVKISVRKLRNSPDTAIKDYAQLLFNLAEANIEDLPAYGITADSQIAMQNDITAYNASIGSPGLSRVELRQITKQIGLLFGTANSALKNMNTAIEIIRLSQPAFYFGFKASQKVIRTGYGALSVKGLVIDAESSLPIEGVSLSFMTIEAGIKATGINGNVVITKKSTKKGGFNIKTLPAGQYTIMIKKPGYADQIVTINVLVGKRTDLNIQLFKV